MEEVTFDDWYALFVEQVRKLGYKGPVDKSSFNDIFDEDVSPEDAAADFVTAMEE